jgi:hypothetical protein
MFMKNFGFVLRISKERRRLVLNIDGVYFRPYSLDNNYDDYQVHFSKGIKANFF